MLRTSSAAILTALSLGVGGCASEAPSLDTAPMSVVRAAQSSIAASGARATAAPRRSGVTARSADDPPTPPAPPRPRMSAPARALATAAAPALAGGACEQYLAARAGRFPAGVRARGEALALAAVTDSVAAALLGMPVVAPRASLAARAPLEDAHARLTRALVAGDDAAAIARATGPLLRDYAQALGIAACG